MTNCSTSPDGPHSPSRRNFMAAVGATVASLQTAACIRKPMERILPFGKRPEDLIPGKPQYYATAYSVGGSVQGVLACSTDGRPTKIEGNPEHPLSSGATGAWAQASVLALYDPERSRAAYLDGKLAAPDKVSASLDEVAQSAAADKGKGLAILVDETPSPSRDRLLFELLERLPEAKLYQHDPAGDAHARAGAAMVGIRDRVPAFSGQPRVLATFDADPMTTDGDSVAFTRMFAAGRDPSLPEGDANRLYSAEPYLTLTGSNADHRLAVEGSRIADVLAALASHLRDARVELPKLKASSESLDLPGVKALAEDLAARPRGTTLVVVGERQPAHVHALGYLINEALGNFGKTLVFVERKLPPVQGIDALVRDLSEKRVQKLVMMGVNPVHDVAGDVPMAKLLEDVPTVIHLGLYRDETGRRSTLHIPESHYLESWGDLVGREGTLSIQQPLIAALYPSMSALELLARLAGRKATAYDLVRETLQPRASGDFEKAWQTWLHDGVVGRESRASVAATSRTLEANWNPGAFENGYELAFIRDPVVLDGRFANSPWLQELPDPITKLTWDNAAIVSPGTAQRLGAETGRFIEISHHGKKLKLPVWIQPGTADGVIALPLGYGRREGGKFARSGFSVAKLRLQAAPYILTGASVQAARGSYRLASTQVETDIRGRPLVRATTRTDFTEDENFVEKFEVMDASHIKTLLWEEPYGEVDHKWGMTIDLNSCTGCGACTVACQAENNIPWVGKEEVLKGREMHWIRVDRYFEPDGDELQVSFQPLNCQQCETAPCENVCPVAATVHSPEGLNDMVYNRCIGTRYCSNNCPYKVRRFNFFHYTVRNDADYGMGIAMQRNPDVTVRYRGVMEKCTYCVQRINRARINAKVHRDGMIRDGEVVTACAQVCAANAITFGNLNEKDAQVTQKADDPRNYAILSELNTRPRTTYLARLSNPNPKLANHG